MVLTTTTVYAGFSEANLKKPINKGPRASIEILDCSQRSEEEQKKSKLCSRLCKEGGKQTYKGKEYLFYPAHCGIEPNHDTYYYVEQKIISYYNLNNTIIMIFYILSLLPSS